MDSFLSSFSFVDEDGVRWTLGTWLKGPGHRYSAPPDPSSPMRVDSPPLNDGDSGQHNDTFTSCAPVSSAEHCGSRMLDESLFTSQISVRQLAKEQWTWYYNHTAAHIPSATARNCNLPSLDDYPGEFDLELGGRGNVDEGPSGTCEEEPDDEVQLRPSSQTAAPLGVALPPQGGRPADKGKRFNSSMLGLC